MSTDRITFAEGFRDVAQNGEIELVSSQHSTLTKADIDESDAGQYTCFVRGTEEAATVELSGKNSIHLLHYSIVFFLYSFK